jgi:hypothetical protein
VEIMTLILRILPHHQLLPRAVILLLLPALRLALSRVARAPLGQGSLRVVALLRPVDRLLVSPVMVVFLFRPLARVVTLVPVARALPRHQ